LEASSGNSKKSNASSLVIKIEFIVCLSQNKTFTK